MGINIEGGLIVGNEFEKMWRASCMDTGDFIDFCEDHEIVSMSPHYHADIDVCVYGFKLDDVYVDEIDKWVLDVKEKAKLFEELTGAKAKLIGMQNVCR